MPDSPCSLPPDALRRRCDPAVFEFETTAELPGVVEVLGQPRAVAALDFGTRIASHGFNLFALGLPGSGKTTLIREYLERRAPGQPVPPDLCYVNNFADPQRPTALRVPAGRAAQLRQDVAALVDDLRATLPKVFDSKEYVGARDKIVGELDKRREAEVADLEVRVAKVGFQLQKESGGVVLRMIHNGTTVTDEELEKLEPSQREKVAAIRDKCAQTVNETLRRIRVLEKAARDELHALNRATADGATRPMVDEVRARYEGLDAVCAFLDALRADVVEHVELFVRSQEESGNVPAAMAALLAEANPFVRYTVNVLVDNGGLQGAPVVIESNPTYHNLVGRIEHRAQFGAMSTDLTMIKPGALHRANGGYLVVPARDVLVNPFAWDGLKRALKDQAVRIEELGAQLGLVSTVTLDPEPVPLEVKLVLIGSPLLYYLLYAYDEDFQKLFKVKADFTTQMDRTPEAERAYGLFVGTIARQDRLPPFDRGAVASVVEYGARLVGDQDKLSARFGEIADLIREAAHQAVLREDGAVTASDVARAIAARRYRGNLIEERLQEDIARGTLLLDTDGVAVGRVNGLSVLSLGDYVFGHPARLTATVAPGRRGVVSIEREVELSGPIHGKGVMILSGYLQQQYGQAGPLGLSGSLVFEQSYGMVEGDSATLAELCVLLSALSGLPLRQDVAVTGSVNQHGHVQPVGGVIEKIEGFFDTCNTRGLTGTQGVLIPEANRKHLMLRDDVVEAARAGRFHVWTAATVDEALALIAGVPAADVHHAAAGCLARYAEMLKERGTGSGEQATGNG